MKGLGILLAIFGIGSAVLHFMGRNFSLLMWIENWGPGVAWAIRAGLILLGALLYALGARARTTSGQKP